jgi:hypothetical protein
LPLVRHLQAVRWNVLQLSLWAGICAGSALAQSTLTGRVLALGDREQVPAAGAWVVASSGSPPRIIASVQADAQGTFRLEGLPEGRVEFTVAHRGYFTYQAGGATAATLARACPASGSCGEADFVVARASVVEGFVSDPFGEPLSDAAVELTQTGESPEASRRGPRGRFGRPMNSTDDRGYFRFYGVMPGNYQLEVRPARLLGEIYSTEPLEVAVELGESSSPLYIAMSVKEEPVRIGGVIDGLNLEGGEVVRILAANVGGGQQRRALAGIQVDTENEGEPRLTGQLTPGEYVLTAEIIDGGGGRRRGPGRVVTLGRYRIDGNMTDLRLAARPGASFSGRIRFEDMEPRRTNLTLVPLDGGTPDTLRFGGNGRFQGPFGRFDGGRFVENPTIERAALLPGRYRLEAASNDYFITSQTEFTLSEGETLRTEIVLSGAFGEVRGTVRPPSEDAPKGPFVVALRDTAGKVISLQTDIEGQYGFPKLLPGDYQICAWADASVDPQSDQAWNAAGSAAKRFPIAAGDRTEILLTAKP